MKHDTYYVSDPNALIKKMGSRFLNRGGHLSARSAWLHKKLNFRAYHGDAKQQIKLSLRGTWSFWIVYERSVKIIFVSRDRDHRISIHPL
jgi:hypothetical protein